MPRNEDGEFELVLGNKQLLSVFFIVVILLGVFFTMGYIVGRNSGPTDTAARRAAELAAGNAAPKDGQSSMPDSKAPPVVVDPPARSVEIPAAKETNAENTVATPEKPAAEERKAEHAKPGPIEVSPVGVGITQPVPGAVYVQVLAVAKPEAEVLAEVLAKKGFHATVVPGPNDKVFRVLVGPAKDDADVGRIRGDLEQAGFKGAFKKKF